MAVRGVRPRRQGKEMLTEGMVVGSRFDGTLEVTLFNAVQFEGG